MFSSANEKREERVARMYDNAKAILTRVLDREDALNTARNEMDAKLAKEFYNVVCVAKSHPFAITKPVFNLMNPIYSLITTYYDSRDTEYVDDEIMDALANDIMNLIHRVLYKISEVEYAAELQRGLKIEDASLPVADEAQTLAKKAGMMDALRGHFSKKEAFEDKMNQTDYKDSLRSDDGSLGVMGDE